MAGDCLAEGEGYERGSRESARGGPVPRHREPSPAAAVSATSRLSLGCLSAASRLPLGCLSAAPRLPLGRPSAASRPPLGRLSAASRPHLGRISAASRLATRDQPAGRKHGASLEHAVRLNEGA